MSQPVRRPTGGEQLTPRQADVLQGIVDVLTDKEIAADLGISHRTVSDHVRIILVKLGCRTRAQAAAEAVRRGLIP